MAGVDWRGGNACKSTSPVRLARGETVDVEPQLRQILLAYDAAGLPWERCLTRLSLASWLAEKKQFEEAA